jgi:hypothetical protein
VFHRARLKSRVLREGPKWSSFFYFRANQHYSTLFLLVYLVYSDFYLFNSNGPSFLSLIAICSSLKFPFLVERFCCKRLMLYLSWRNNSICHLLFTVHSCSFSASLPIKVRASIELPGSALLCSLLDSILPVSNPGDPISLNFTTAKSGQNSFNSLNYCIRAWNWIIRKEYNSSFLRLVCYTIPF